jgi:trehalose 6-phosphate synthase/phosphatase
MWRPGAVVGKAFAMCSGAAGTETCIAHPVKTGGARAAPRRGVVAAREYPIHPIDGDVPSDLSSDHEGETHSMTKRPRVIIASNRLPVVVQARGADCVVSPATGGLATGLRAFHDRGESVWIGSAGEPPAGHSRRTRVAAALLEQRIVPVNLQRSEYKRYYDGVCNGILWPLLHYQTERIPLGAADWAAYRAVNERFAAAIVREYRAGDVIWIHDYHLLLVPRLVRDFLPDAAIGFFLHVPFPATEVFRTAPWRREILDGLLGADVIGFHTGAYAAHFLDAVRALAPPEACYETGLARERRVHVDVYPMGIDVRSFSGAASDAAVHRERALIEGGREHRLLLGVDRLDYTKGIPRRLLAYDRLLRDNPHLRGRVRFIQVAVPSRESVPSYQRLRREIDELVGRINGEHGTVDWTPIQYVHRSISHTQLVALYGAADVMLVTPLRDGMNLVAKEFVASRIDGDGVLVLSEFAGAAEQLAEAVSVNPYSVEALAATMRAALTMPEPERRRRMAALRTRVMAHDVHAWAAQFLADLRQQAAEAPQAEAWRAATA